MRETASKSGLMLSGCNRWQHPAAAWYKDRPEHAQKREDGNVFHHCINLHEQGLPYKTPHGDVGKLVRIASEYWDKELKPRLQWYRTEQAMGIGLNSLAPVVQILENTDRDYPQDDNSLFGTADIVGVLKNGQTFVADWKTGESHGAEEQLKTLLYMATYGYNPIAFISGRVSVLSVSIFGVEVSEREVSWQELHAHYDSIRDAITKSRSTAKPSLPVVGNHCTSMYCPHLAHCPAHQTSMNNLSDIGGAVPPSHWTDVPIGTDHAGAMAFALKAVRRMTKYYDGQLRDWVEAGNRIVYKGMEWKDAGAGYRWYKI